jgi:hypothetical protein
MISLAKMGRLSEEIAVLSFQIVLLRPCSKICSETHIPIVRPLRSLFGFPNNCWQLFAHLPDQNSPIYMFSNTLVLESERNGPRFHCSHRTAQDYRFWIRHIIMNPLRRRLFLEVHALMLRAKFQGDHDELCSGRDIGFPEDIGNMIPDGSH